MSIRRHPGGNLSHDAQLSWTHIHALDRAPVLTFIAVTPSAALRAGLRAASIHPLSDLKDKTSIGLEGFIREALNPRWQSEFNLGYSNLMGET